MMQWMLPRRPRGVHAVALRPWRALWLSKSCKACHGDGTFPVMMHQGLRQSTVALLCR
jgi:hypothetical protein